MKTQAKKARRNDEDRNRTDRQFNDLKAISPLEVTQMEADHGGKGMQSSCVYACLMLSKKGKKH